MASTSRFVIRPSSWSPACSSRRASGNSASSGSAVVGAFFCLTLVAVSATDLEHRIIPNRIVVPAGLVVLAANTALHPSPRFAIGAVGASGFLLAAALAYPAGWGWAT